MSKFLDMELIVAIEGGVQETNLTDFEKQGKELLKQINLNPKTDDEFAVAHINSQDCKKVEDRIEEAKAAALAKVDDIQSLFGVMDDLQAAFRKTRLDLEKKVKNEKVARRKRIIDHAINKIKTALVDSSVPHDPTFRNYAQEVIDATKNKRKIESLQEGVDEVVAWYYDQISDKSDLYDQNMKLIDQAELGLFPDAKDIGLKSHDEVSAIITARVNEAKLREAERISAEQAKQAKELAKSKIEKTPTHQEEPPSVDFPSFDDFPTLDPAAEPEPEAPNTREIGLTLQGTDEEMNKFIDQIIVLKVVKGVTMNPNG